MIKRAHFKRYGIGILFLLFLSCQLENKIAEPFDLTLNEGISNPIGFYDNQPTFSWKLPKEIKKQKAYSIVVASSPDLLHQNADLWQSGKVESDQSLYVKYEGTPLNSRQKVFWSIKYWDESGNESNWSEMAYFELGLLSNLDWTAKWIRHPDIKLDSLPEIDRKIHKIQYLRKEIQLEPAIKHARLYISAKGLYEAEINGKKVGEGVLTPGWTPYEKRIESLSYDVAHLLQDGSNAMGLMLAEGWHSGRLLFRNYTDKLPEIIAQLEITYENGTRETFVTDDSWKVSIDGPIQYSSLYDGEIYDANKEMPLWSTANFNVEDWTNATQAPLNPEVLLRPKSHTPISNKSELKPISISEPITGQFVFDLGQNMAGVPHINIPVKKGQRVKIRVSEMLQNDGSIYIDNYRGALSTDYYTPAEDGNISWHPKFTFHGFRYIELSGFDEDHIPKKEWVTGLVQYSDFDMSASFISSHEKLNQLQSNIEWGLRGNFLDIPTDCPQRNERLGWTGDAQVFVPTSLFNADVHSFWSSWLKSVREDQNEDGGIPWYVPKVNKGRSSSGWGDAITIIPWEIYQRTGDQNILNDNYQAMHKWLNYYESKATNHIVTMFTFGDWLQPYSKNPENTKKGETDDSLVSTAYYARSIELTRQTAEVLGLQEDANRLKTLRDEVRQSFQNTFFDDDGRVSVGTPTQTGYLMALGFNLLTPELEEKVVPHLLTEIRNADNHLRTGFLGTPLLAPVLEKINRPDLMFTILFKETYPSWFYSINQGATTMWERWDSYSHEEGFHKEGMNSFNHYAYGAIGQWMYERIAGIQALEPGYKSIRIAPLLGGPIDSVSAEYDSPYGWIKSEWKLEDDSFKINTTIPPNTSAEVIVPGDTSKELLMTGGKLSEHPGIRLIKKLENAFKLELDPGQYEFTSTIN